ncbi:hypothetical protein CYMTET_18894 [Cymbomonas tetramitiformis]|uniref:Uncharacterized protein n=1 Tax=Cymbomonas tetramitiformis TaxID=36881 RepID=A0AAE0G754_9CHLO|nr:hypothetical protein CYMTET_18894 [Cymbomonas tetramitiformis]
MLGVSARCRECGDPHDAISDFNAALKAARTRSTFDEEDRAAHDLLTIQQCVRECYAAHIKAGTVTDTGFASAARFRGRQFMEKDEDAAAHFQRVIDKDNSEEFNALCILASGRPDIVADLSAACSVCEDDGECLVSAIDEYTDIVRSADTDALHINIFNARNDMPLQMVPAATRPSPVTSVSSGEEWTGPPDYHPFIPQHVTRTFADFVGGTGFFTVEVFDSEPHANMNTMSAVAQPAHSDGYATSTDEEDVALSQPPPRLGCCMPVPVFGRSLLTSPFVCVRHSLCVPLPHRSLPQDSVVLEGTHARLHPRRRVVGTEHDKDFGSIPTCLLTRPSAYLGSTAVT